MEKIDIGLLRIAPHEDPYALANNNLGTGVAGSARQQPHLNPHLSAIQAGARLKRPQIAVPMGFNPTTPQALKDANLITEDDLNELSLCDDFQNGLVLSHACIEHLRNGRTIDFDRLKNMSEPLVAGLKQQQGLDDASVALLYTHPCMKPFPIPAEYRKAV